MINKRGVSDFVVNALVITVVIAAIGFIAVFVFKIVNRAEFSPAVDCLVLQTSESTKIENACVENGFLKVRISRFGEGLKINRIFFIVKSEAGESKWCCGEGCGGCGLIEGTKNYEIGLSEIGNANKIILENNGCVLDESDVKAC